MRKILFVCMLTILFMTGCGGNVEVPQDKEESYSFTGTWLSEDKETVVNYILHCYTDGQAIMECHKNVEGSWKEVEEGILSIKIGKESYEAKLSQYTGKYSFKFQDTLGSDAIEVRMETAGDDSMAAQQTDEMLIEVYQKSIEEMVRKFEGKNGEIIFYGASNFVKWESLEDDMEGYPVQNKSFGGSNDVTRYHFVKELIYDAEPAIVVYMSSSNDWTRGQSLEEVVAFKQKMFDEMAEKLPDTVFIILSSTPNPLRYYGEYQEKMQKCDMWTKEYCDTHDNYVYLDVVPGLSLNNGKTPNTELWIEDQLHLNEAGYDILAELVRNALKTVCEENELTW